MSKYEHDQHLIDTPEPDGMFLAARQIANNHLQEQINLFNKGEVRSRSDGFLWLNKELNHPSFEDFTLVYKNSVFAIVVVLISESGSSFTEQQELRLLKYCDENNLIPCLFIMKLEQLGTIEDEEGLCTISTFDKECNLYDPRTNNKIDPTLLASDEKTVISEWELNKFGNQLLSQRLNNNGYKVLKYCDVPDIYPQLWFMNKEGKTCWMIMKYFLEDEEFDYQDWVGFEKQYPHLQAYDGYISPLQFRSINLNADKNLYRGNRIETEFMETKKIYTPVEQSDGH